MDFILVQQWLPRSLKLVMHDVAIATIVSEGNREG